MEITLYPDRGAWPALLRRPVQDYATYRTQVLPILDAVRREGDAALRRFSLQFDGVAPEHLALSAGEWAAGLAQVPEALQVAIDAAADNIRRFHRAQWRREAAVETTSGVRCWRRSTPIERVGLYIPGGSAPLFSTVLMLGIPAQVAGCSQVVLCTPPQPDGQVHPGVLYAARACGITRVFRCGGAQAIAAMAYGTETIPQADKIFGPGNPWVTAAKQLVSLDGVAIDLPAGPSEVCIVADHSARADWVAADLLSQAEHGADSQVLLITTDPALPPQVQAALEAQLADLPRRTVAAAALAQSRMIVVKNLREAMALANAYAPEHLILQLRQARQMARQVQQAGSVFIGHFTPESAGDYASGTNHTLPTGGYARAYAGVSLDSFIKKITFQEITENGLRQLGPVIETMARAESLDAHARAVSIRTRS